MVAVLVIFLTLVVFCMVMAIKFRNPYKLTMVFGKKGSGKTTFLVKQAVMHMRRGQTVYSTVYIPGAHLFDVQLIGNYTFPPESVVFIDEVGMIWDNRNFKAFRPEVRDWFKLQRHYHVKVYLFSQTFDIDIKLRNLTDEMYLCQCHMGFLSIARKIKRSIILVQPSGESESRIADSLEFVPLWLSLFGAKSAVFTYIPNWVGLFNSFETPDLPVVASALQEIPDSCRRFYDASVFRRRWYSFLILLSYLRQKRPTALAVGARKTKVSRRKKRKSVCVLNSEDELSEPDKE